MREEISKDRLKLGERETEEEEEEAELEVEKKTSWL